MSRAGGGAPAARVATAAGVAVTVAALVAGCTESGHGTTSTVPPPSTASVPSVPVSAPAPTVSDPTTSLPPPPPSTPPASNPPSTPPPATGSSTAPPPAAEKSTCGSLTIRVLRGGAINSREVAGVEFENTGTSSCVLVGYPTVTLLRNGKRVGTVSEPSTDKPSRRSLAPGDVAESRLLDYTSKCEAPLSDSIKVVAPGSTISLVRHQFEMRGCLLRVDPLGPPE